MEVGCGATAVPILQFFEFHTEFARGLEGGKVITQRHFLKRAAREIRVFFHSGPPIGMIRLTIRLKLSSLLIRAGSKGILPLSIRLVAPSAS